MPDKITNPIMNFTSKFYEEDVRRGVAEILRRRAEKAEAERAAERREIEQNRQR